MNKYKYEYCLGCKKDHSDRQDEEICECGSKDFVYGDNIKITENGVTCQCDSPKLNKTSHINMNPIYNTTYVCENCGNIIGKQVYYESL